MLQSVRVCGAQDSDHDAVTNRSRRCSGVLQHKCRAPARMRRSAGCILKNGRGGWLEGYALDRLRSAVLQHKKEAGDIIPGFVVERPMIRDYSRTR